MRDTGVARSTSVAGATWVPIDRKHAVASARARDEGHPGVEILCKAECYNPGGSVKDRPAMNMIRDGERTGKLEPGGTIIDSTSGNTGIAYAMIGAATTPGSVQGIRPP